MKASGWFGIAVLCAAVPLKSLAQGSLTPPGAPGATMKTLDQMEPRIPVTNVPFTITQSGSYYLTTNLTAGAGQDGILVQADDVTIDLMGFTLAGSGTNSGHGISQAGNYRNLTVLNGKVVNWRNSNFKGGIYAQGSSCRISGIQAATNYYGIYAGDGALLTRCQAQYNRSIGIHGGDRSIINNCSAMNSALSTGIYADDGSALNDCAAANNYYGFDVRSGSTISRCTALYNTMNGIDISAGCIIKDCTSHYNGSAGIYMSGGNIVKDCVAMFNTGDGIRAGGSGNRIEANNAFQNTGRGIAVDGPANVIVGNSASGNTGGNYSIPGGNAAGAITNSPTGAWDNFAF